MPPYWLMGSTHAYAHLSLLRVNSKSCEGMGLKHLQLSILVLSLAALCVALVLPHWHCGSLFERCTQEGASKRDVMLAVTCCLVIGITMLAVVCIIDFIHLCSDTRSGVERGVRLALLYIGSLLTLAAVILYTVEISGSWSYFIATCGSIFAVQLSLMALLYGRCCNSYSAGVRINECR
ncbi:hypothetical protein ECG_06444 [Echinococcus granulosus]|nr:hypothetical protein ECG_06444 [Echinococcus granulosus]